MEDSEDHQRIYLKLQNFCKINEQFHIAFKIVDRCAKYGIPQKNAILLKYIAGVFLHIPQYFEETVFYFLHELPKILSISLDMPFNSQRNKQNCILLGKLIHKRPDIASYAFKYFETNPCPFATQEEEEVIKRSRIDSEINIDDLEFVESCYNLLRSSPAFYRDKWPWSYFIDIYFNHNDPRVVWITCLCISLITSMNENKLNSLLHGKMNPEIVDKYSSQYAVSNTLTEIHRTPPPLNQYPDLSLTNYSENVVNVAGIYVPSSAQVKQTTESNSLVEVESTKNNLKKVALALNSSKAICLVGNVGCGKTSLLEYLAAKTGRKLGDDFIKMQLGDETDSKMLLGTYHCTDVPGEFIWRLGILTQAVIEGFWLLLEDIDLASMDIASVLTSLLENNKLTVPGYKDSLSIKPGFKLFVTQRLLGSQKKSNAMILMEKYLVHIYIDPFTNEELRLILNIRYPIFKTVSERMLNVFLLFSSNKIGKARSVTTRDLLKWCQRAVVDFNVSSQSSALNVLQDAVDIFCGSLSDANEALQLAREISTNLGIINQKAEYFLKQYKPSTKLTAVELNVGRAKLKRDTTKALVVANNFYYTRPSTVLLERIMTCINLKEAILLVGETGTGKTSAIQYLASITGQKLIVINMNQQSDSADLLGGFKPVDLTLIISPIKRQFESVFRDYFQIGPNQKFLSHITTCFNEKKWASLVKLMYKSYEAAMTRLVGKESDEKSLKVLSRWQDIGQKLQKLNSQLKQKSHLAFAFIEGSLVKAVENGHWVLLDEINLANADTLECLSGLIESETGSLCLLERGDKKPIKRHPNFTLFACMNPSTDVGKKDLPLGLRNRFTEFFVNELNEKSDLLYLVDSYLKAMSLKENYLNKIVGLYLKLREEADLSLTDGLGHKPHYSLRSLCRALLIANKNPCGSFKRSLYEAFCLSFLTQLDSTSYKVVEQKIANYLVGDEKTLNALLKQPIPQPQSQGDSFLQFEGYWIRKGPLECCTPENYILTDSVRKNLKDLVRVASIGKLPVLLQGDTSIGKTSLITYLAKSSGNKCVRINNHEHTDLQEYIGSYVADTSGKLAFREGVLVEAMRKGHWIILDELNLAPTDVLEALNRVLDDNRELFIPETQQIVKADPNFMLFATQNPPGSYGGRKMLSRAFRNRFVELHFSEIPPKELQVILHKRCHVAESCAKKMINVMTDLQMRRRGSAAFAGKQGFITLRDLFRWGERYRLAPGQSKLYDWDQHLADEGYLVLAGRVRKAEEKQEVLKVLQKHLKRNVDPKNLFTLSDSTSPVTRDILEKVHENELEHKNIVWTYNMRQLAVLVSKALQFKEPVLLVGDTGGGKTTICKLIAEDNGLELLTINCHMNSESSDFIGGLRPVRDHSENTNKLFEWVDGPLIEAMRKGCVFLADEISLADDSVLERLNSLLEPERSLLLAEKGTDINNPNNSELLFAHDNFHFIGTMNPGGDFGKKELSPALRNRFTEIWCEPCTLRDDLVAIIERNINFDRQDNVGEKIMDFIEWFKSTEIGKRFTISIRDILTWVNFLNAVSGKIGLAEAYWHGVYLTFLDSLGSGTTGAENENSLKIFKQNCDQFITKQIGTNVSSINLEVERSGVMFGIKPFFIEMGDCVDKNMFCFEAPTTVLNTLRILRGMQLNKAILLEGSPGVGKTSLVTALAKTTGHKIFRVNLSDQTDISDLFGADLPVEGGVGGQFSWRDGPLLQALKQGDWILLDELNLASQSVLEGLNACLDHRGEIFIPELGKTFRVKPNTRFFACQNPLKQGGSRKGLPQSFLNRFIQVHVTVLTRDDLEFILLRQFENLPGDIIKLMVKFNDRVVNELSEYKFGNKGAPWEFNLRDLTRWCEATIYHFNSNPNVEKTYQPENLVHLIYGDRMRTLDDKNRVKDIFQSVFNRKVQGDVCVLYVNNEKVFVGDGCLQRNTDDLSVFSGEKGCLVLRSQLAALRTLLYAVNLNWMSLLVGTSASGKSTIVKTLAQICGKTLKTLPVTSAMDTTDILGGFEQVDYTRHLDELVKDTENLVQHTAQSLLINEDTATACKALRLWEGYLNIEGVNIQTLEDQTNQFLCQLSKLEVIWEFLEQFLKANTVLKEIRKKASQLSNLVKNEGSLNAGGKFEWVDSVLIKCLQEGWWLLVDNVNLCSAAVLDRLNALLEPNGILTVSERGVDTYGNMFEIKPHKDFRIFLTMDPKNGEISRAMRNRGLEIYLLNDRECGCRDELDIKSLINLESLSNIDHINALLKIHHFICEVTVGDKPNITELLQASAMIYHQMNQGIESFDAFFNTIIEVYYKTRNLCEFNCNNAIDVIKAELQNILSAPKAQNELYNANVTIRTDNLQICSKIEKIKQQCSTIQSFKNEPKLLNFLLINYYSISSLEDLNTKTIYLKRLIKNEFIESTAVTLQGFLEHKSNVSYKNLPIDFKWNPEAFYPEKNCNRTNKIILALYFLMEKRIEYRNETLDKAAFSLLDYLKNKQAKKIDDNFDDRLTNEFLNLIKYFDLHFESILDQDVSLDDKTFITILCLISWRFIFYRCSLVNIKRLNSAQKALVNINLKVHYQWFFKYSVEKLNSLLKPSGSKDLTFIVTEINSTMEQHNSLYKLGSKYQKIDHKPPPWTSENQIRAVKDLIEIKKLYKDCNIRNETRNALIELKAELSFDFSDVSNKLNQLKSKEKIIIDRSLSELLPFVDYFAKLGLKKTIVENLDNYNEFITISAIPWELMGILIQFHSKKDARIGHELRKLLFLYLINSPSSSILKDSSLHNHNPILSLYMSSLTSENRDSLVKLGNYRTVVDQHRHINLMLWRNMDQLSQESYDQLYFDKKYVEVAYKNFIKKICATLNFPTPKNDAVEIEQICTALMSAPNQDLNNFILNLRKSSQLIQDLKISNETNDKLFVISSLFMKLGYLKIVLNSKLQLIDPVLKKSLKKKYCAEQIDYFENMKKSYEIYNEILCGKADKPHSHYYVLCEFIKDLYEKNENLRKYIAVRENDIHYDNVLKSVTHAFSTIFSYDYLNKTLSPLDDSIMKLSKGSKDSCKRILEENENHVKSYESLLSQWSTYVISYPDIVEPLLSNLAEFLYGYKLKISLLKKLIIEQNYNLNLNETLMNFISFPFLNKNNKSFGKQIKFYCNKAFSEFLDKTLDDSNIKKRENLRILKCGLMETFNNCVVQGEHSGILDKNLFNHFEKLLKAFTNVWNEQEKLKEIKQKEAEALYKFKAAKSEEEELKESLELLFPSHLDEDFSDFQNDPAIPKEPSTDLFSLISNEELQFIVKLHRKLLLNFTKTEWLNPPKNKNITVDFVTPLLEKHQLLKLLLNKIIQGLDYKLDVELLGTFSVVLAISQNCGQFSHLVSETNSPLRNVQQSSNFYKDPNVDEVKNSYHILEDLKVRVGELHNEWPDHPTLKTLSKAFECLVAYLANAHFYGVQSTLKYPIYDFLVMFTYLSYCTDETDLSKLKILNVIERIREFEITSPISRFLTGFELLLGKCHEWEEVAHSNVSLREHSQNIIQQVIHWRKMELSLWRDLLNYTFDRLNEPISKWWVYMYNVMEQFIINEAYTDVELIETLQKFITQSNLAEFQNRLNLLYVFHCHATYMKRTERTQLFINILWNLHGYFNQYSCTISNKIKELRSPIEKKLKDYVKIVRWKDVNYWAIKQTVEKSHKTLHKFVREFEEVLKRPVSTYLVNTNEKNDENVGIWDRPRRQTPKTYHYTLEPLNYVAKSTLEKNFGAFEGSKIFTGRLKFYFSKSRNLCKEAILKTEYPILIQSLDLFITDVIETSSHLQGLEVDTSLHKNKQRSQAKSILQQKQRALADLFKSLSKIGLSFRTGIVESKVKMTASDFLIRPLDLFASLSHIHANRKDEKILTIWENSEMYYLKSLMRADVLATALNTPAPDLGLQNIERCKGFAAHLLSFVHKQKLELIESSRLFYYLRFYTNQFTKICDCNEYLPYGTVENLLEILKDTIVVMNQYRIILNTCPTEDALNSQTELFILKPEPQKLVQYKYDETWNEASGLTKDVVSLATRTMSNFEKSKGAIPAFEYKVTPIKYVPISNLSAIKADLTDILGKIRQLHSLFSNCSLGKSLDYLTEQMNEFNNSIGLIEADEREYKNVHPQFETLTEQILLIIQNIFKKYSTREVNNDDESIKLQDMQLKSKIIEELSSDLSLMNMKTILKQTHDLACEIFSIPPNQISEYKDLILLCIPFLEQLTLLYQYFITQQVSAYRVTCKMTSILLNIFIDLTSKGFCIPPEFSEQLNSEGMSKPSDGLGLGEGEGEKDVSDRIESEDQLEEAQQEGKEKEDKEESNCKEEEKGIEMSEDFDSNLQDVQPNEDEECEDNNSDAEEQMGDTEKGADQLDREVWGSEEEDENPEDDEEPEASDKGQSKGEQQLGSKDENTNKEDEDGNKEGEEPKNQKEINEMQEAEIDDHQIDPYHGNQPELPEPEAMDLPDDLQLDEGEEPENEKQEENPFDIDTMKEQTITEDKKEEKQVEETQNDEVKEYSSDEEEIDKLEKESEDAEKDELAKQDTQDNIAEDEDQEKEKEVENLERSALDQSQSNSDNVEAMDVDSEATDKVESNAETQQSQQPADEVCQADNQDTTGTGQSAMEESASGHSAQTTALENIQNTKRTHEEIKKNKGVGDSDDQRTLGDTNEPVQKKLKTVDGDKEEGDENGKNEEVEKESELYKHIKDAKEDVATQVLDAATKEQAENQQNPVLDDKDQDDKQHDNKEELMEENKEEIKELSKEKLDQKVPAKDKKGQKSHAEGDILDEIQDVSIDGDIIETSNVQRGADSTFKTIYSDLKADPSERLNQEEISNLRREVEQQLSTWKEPPSTIEADRAWQKISSTTLSLAQDLSEQLRLVLEPTQASRLKGDFRTGRRINMRRVIPYIASQFRKDKIWLRRTKPSKREYQIILAIDDSSSMADNRSKELTFESIALISKALTLLESGQLSVLSFGERVEVLHKLNEQFTDKSGVKLLQQFAFNQNKTCVAKLVDFVTEMFNQSQSSSSALNAKLLIIVSDGRGIFSEDDVRQAVRRAKLANIFMVFVIVDNPENKHSILDIKTPIFKDGKIEIQTYMDLFPFNFYIILKDINSLPNILSDALRQWFEVVSNLDKI